MESFSKTDAITYPLVSAAVLTSLYLIIKLLEDPALLNLILRWWFYFFSVFAVSRLVSDVLHVAHTFIFPKLYSSGGKIWAVDQKNRKAVVWRDGSSDSVRNSPLPGIFSTLPLPNTFLSSLWAYRKFPDKKLTIKLFVRRLIAVRYHLDIFGAIGLLVALSAMAFETFVRKVWWIHNLFGFAFCYNSLILMSPTSFSIGTILLVGLFFYDIIMVFYTPMMIGVAKAIDVPIMLMIPRPKGVDEDPSVRSFGVLGLGDVVLPGIFIGLALRFDLYLHYLAKQHVFKRISSAAMFKHLGLEHYASAENPKDALDEVRTHARYVSPTKNWANQFWTASYRLPATIDLDLGVFRKTYFNASILGYILGMVATQIALHFSDHPQPALLYLVPGVLGAVWLTALWRGELKTMLDYTEDIEDGNVKSTKENKDGKKRSKKANGLFRSSEHGEAIARRQLKAYGIEDGESGSEADTEAPADNTSTATADKTTQSKSEDNKGGNKHHRDKHRILILFSISTHAPLKRGKGREKDGVGKKEPKEIPKWALPNKESNEELPKKRQRIS